MIRLHLAYVYTNFATLFWLVKSILINFFDQGCFWTGTALCSASFCSTYRWPGIKQKYPKHVLFKHEFVWKPGGNHVLTCYLHASSNVTILMYMLLAMLQCYEDAGVLCFCSGISNKTAHMVIVSDEHGDWSKQPVGFGGWG